jgi:hypothetical protein
MSLMRINQIQDKSEQIEVYERYVMSIVSNLRCTIEEAQDLMSSFPSIDVADACVKGIDNDNTWIDGSVAEQMEIMQLQKEIKNLRKPI